MNNFQTKSDNCNHPRSSINSPGDILSDAKNLQLINQKDSSFKVGESEDGFTEKITKELKRERTQVLSYLNSSLNDHRSIVQDIAQKMKEDLSKEKQQMDNECLMLRSLIASLRKELVSSFESQFRSQETKQQQEINRLNQAIEQLTFNQVLEGLNSSVILMQTEVRAIKKQLNSLSQATDDKHKQLNMQYQYNARAYMTINQQAQIDQTNIAKFTELRQEIERIQKVLEQQVIQNSSLMIKDYANEGDSRGSNNTKYANSIQGEQIYPGSQQNKKKKNPIFSSETPTYYSPEQIVLAAQTRENWAQPEQVEPNSHMPCSKLSVQVNDADEYVYKNNFTPQGRKSDQQSIISNFRLKDTIDIVQRELSSNTLRSGLQSTDLQSLDQQQNNDVYDYFDLSNQNINFELNSIQPNETPNSLKNDTLQSSPQITHQKKQPEKIYNACKLQNDSNPPIEETTPPQKIIQPPYSLTNDNKLLTKYDSSNRFKTVSGIKAPNVQRREEEANISSKFSKNPSHTEDQSSSESLKHNKIMKGLDTIKDTYPKMTYHSFKQQASKQVDSRTEHSQANLRNQQLIQQNSLKNEEQPFATKEGGNKLNFMFNSQTKQSTCLIDNHNTIQPLLNGLLNSEYNIDFQPKLLIMLLNKGGQLSKHPEKEEKEDQIEFKIDDEGFVSDIEGCILIDDRGQKMKLSEEHIKYLKMTKNIADDLNYQ